MTDNEIRQLRAEWEEIRKEHAAHTAALATADPPPTSEIARTGLSAAELAVRNLVANSGWTLDQARAEVLARGVEPFAAEIAYEAQQVNAKRAEGERAAFDKTPDGVMAEADALLAEDEQLEREVSAGSRLLLDRGFTEDDLKALSDEEILFGSAVWQPADEPDPNSWAANWDAANAMNDDSSEGTI